MKEKEQRQYEEACVALETLEREGFEARLAGGCVRDRLMRRSPKDYDIATNALPQAVTDLFVRRGQKIVPTGLEHGTVTLVMPAGPIEITTLRSDVETDGRRAKVSFARATFEADAARRDFTVNAMFEDRQGKIFDYFEGRKALKEGRLIFVGDPVTRIREDYLRILRLFRFWARLGFAPDADALVATTAERLGLKRISQERITSELLQTFAQEYCEIPLRQMIQAGILGVVIPQLEGKTLRPEFTEELGQAEFFGHGAARKEDKALVRMASLFFEQIDVEARGRQSEDEFFKEVGAQMRLSQQDSRKLAFLLSGWNEFGITGDETAEKMAFLDRCEEVGGPNGWGQVFLPFWLCALRHTRHHDAVQSQRVLEALARCETENGWLRRSKLPLTGHDVMQASGLEPGAHLGVFMEKLLRLFRNGVWSTRDEGLELIKEGRVIRES